MEPAERGLDRLKDLADATKQKAARAAKDATKRVVDVGADARGAATKASGQARELAGVAEQKVAQAAKGTTQRVVQVAGDTQAAAKRTADQVMVKAADAAEAMPSWVPFRRKEVVDLTQLPDGAKLSYCSVLASLARADGRLDPREISNLYLFASTIGLGVEARSELREIITTPPQDVIGDSEVRRTAVGAVAALLSLVDEDEREAVTTMLVRDLVRIARADQQVADSERELIVFIAGLAFPETADELVSAAEGLVATEEEFAAGKLTTSQMETKSKDIVAKAAAFGIPVAAISLAGVSGLSAAGITSGLAALGFGGLLGLSSMVTGIGVVVILGVVVHQGVRYALGTNERERANRREALIQQVIRNHQQAMADLTDDIAALAGRMEEYLTQTSKNEDRLAALRSELAAFKQALVDLQVSQKGFEDGEPVNVG